MSATETPKLHTFHDVPQFDAHAIGARIALARREKELTQEELAGACSFSYRSLANYEAGISIPFKHLHELSEVLERRVAWFLYGDEINPDQLSGIEAQLSEALERLQRILALLDVVNGGAEPPRPPAKRRSRK